MVVVILLAFDPFLQAVVAYPGTLDDLATADVATVWRTQTLDIGSLVIEHSEPIAVDGPTKPEMEFENFGTRPDFGIVAAVNAGFSNTTILTQSTPKYTCPTGNCTWNAFTSLAFCSVCNDAKERLKSTSDYGLYGSNTDVNITSSLNPKGQFRQFSLPYSHLTLGWQGNTANITVGVTADPSETATFRDLRTLLASFAILRTPEDYYTVKVGTPANPDYDYVSGFSPSATECALYFCVNAYETSSQNSKVTEVVTHSWAESNPDSWQPLGPDNSYEDTDTPMSIVQEWWNNQSKSLHQPFHTIYLSDLQLLAPPGPWVSSSIPRYGRYFNVTQKAVTSTINFLLSWTLGDNNMLVYPPSIPLPINSTLPTVAEALFKSNNLTTTFNNVAQSLTQHIRDTASVAHNGTAQQWVIHVKVDWPFITLPLIAMVGGCVYVLLTMWETTQLRLPAWKENAAASLAYGLPADAQALLRTADQSGELNSRAKAMLLRFGDDGDGYRLLPV